MKPWSRVRAVVVAVLLPVVAALVAGSTHAATLKLETVAQTVTLPPGSLSNPSTTPVTVECPDGYLLVGATYKASTELGQAVVGVHASVWGPSLYFVVLSNSGSAAQDVTVKIQCSGKAVRAGGARYEVSKPAVKVSELELGPDGSASELVRCPKRTAPVFGGYETHTAVEALNSHPSDNGWFHLFKNDGIDPSQAVTQTVCFKQRLKPKGGGRRHTGAAKRAARKRPKLQLKTRSEQAELGARTPTRVTARCPARYRALSGGFGQAGARADVVATAIGRRTYSATLLSLSSETTGAATVVCARVLSRP